MNIQSFVLIVLIIIMFVAAIKKCKKTGCIKNCGGDCGICIKNQPSGGNIAQEIKKCYDKKS